ncbi:hypothetical protein [Emcibacter sp. SYSU 3D8]|uniref:hypothetical protein n=1 Tax=Emcibacter sp. SYSU 3D8 TaxID=3133969 RepID=UPI0031FE464A
MPAVRLLAAALVLSLAVAGCSSKPQRSPLPKDRNAVDRISNAYVRAVELQAAGDCEKASRLLFRVAMQGIGYEDAQRRLGECTIVLAKGERTRYLDGIVWLRRAAEAGWPEAQGSLAYEYATGPMADGVEAARWLTLYENNPRMKRLGFTPMTADKLARIRAMITPEQLAKGQAAAAAFVPVTWTPPAAAKRDAVEDLKESEAGNKRGPGPRRSDDADRPIGGEFPQPGQ